MLMKYLISIYILFGFFQNTLAQDSTRTKLPTGFISIVSQADTTSILLNNRFIGKTPILKMTIPTGQYEIEAIPSQLAEWNRPTWKKSFELAENDSVFFEVALPRQLYINSQPYDAQVIYRNQTIGTTPLFFTMPDTTLGLIVLRKPGYLDYIIKPEQLNSSFLDAQLKEDKKIKEAKLHFSSIIQNRQKRKKILTYSMLGLSVASGISAIYFKKQADDRYGNYLAASHPTDINRLYDETQRLDNYTAVAYGVFQVSFVTSLYLLLFKK